MVLLGDVRGVTFASTRSSLHTSVPSVPPLHTFEAFKTSDLHIPELPETERVKAGVLKVYMLGN